MVPQQAQRQQVSFPFALYTEAKKEGHSRIEKFGDSFHVLVRRFTGVEGKRTEVAPVTGTFAKQQVQELLNRLNAQAASVKEVLDDMNAIELAEKNVAKPAK